MTGFLLLHVGDDAAADSGVVISCRRGLDNKGFGDLACPVVSHRNYRTVVDIRMFEQPRFELRWSDLKTLKDETRRVNEGARRRRVKVEETWMDIP